MTKLLAALNLPQVGAISMVPPDPNDEENDGSLFTIELNERYYTLKASDKEEAEAWVENLKKLQASGVDGGQNATGATVNENPDAYIQTPAASSTKNDVPQSNDDEEGSWNKKDRLFGCC